MQFLGKTFAPPNALSRSATGSDNAFFVLFVGLISDACNVNLNI